MKLSELKNEAALDALAEMIEPAVEIMSDKEFVVQARGNNMVQAVKVAIKKHKKAIIALLAATEGKKPEEYEVSLVTLPVKLLELFNDEEVVNLFQLQGQMTEKKFSGSAMESIEAEEA